MKCEVDPKYRNKSPCEGNLIPFRVGQAFGIRCLHHFTMLCESYPGIHEEITMEEFMISDIIRE